jgi:VWFA-related protein
MIAGAPSAAFQAAGSKLPVMGPWFRRTQNKNGATLRPILFLVLALAALPAAAAKRVTVAQLEQALTASVAAHKPDAEIAHQLLSMEPTERLTETTLGRLKSLVDPGSRTALALELLADQSEFLEPPSSELPATPAPDAAAQLRLLAAAQRFALETLQRLPNLLATRATFSFDDSPQVGPKGGYAQRMGLHLVGSSKTEVSVRNEREHPSSGAGPAGAQAHGGLESWGEFGAALLIILSDSGAGKTAWSHWEQTSSGPMAVFHYEVPKSASHYEIDTPVEEIQSSGSSARWAGSRASDMGPVSKWTRMTRTKPGYQGTLWVDPKTGNIARLTLVAELKGNPAFERGAILIDYGPVNISGQTLICPVRSLALSSAPSTVNSTFAGVATEWLNENLFLDYHIFASKSRILTDQADSTPPAEPSAAATAADASAPASNSTAQTSSSPAAPSAAPSPQQTEAASASSPQIAETASPAAPAANSMTATQESAAGAAPSALAQTAAASQEQTSPAQPAAPPGSEFTLHVNVNSLLVPVVVRDGHGRIVGDLNKQDFEVFDNDKPRPISAFTVERHATPEMATTAGQQPAAHADAAPQAQPASRRFLVFLFDDFHLSTEDLAQAQKAAVKALDGTLTASDEAAVVSLSGKTNTGFTLDHVKLKDAIMSLRPMNVYRVSASDCPHITYYQADLMENKRDGPAEADAIAQVFACNPAMDRQRDVEVAQRLAHSAAMQALNLGNQDIRVTYAAIGSYVHAMAALPGERILVLVSPGFLGVEQEALAGVSKAIDIAVQSNVAISALDARGVYVTNIGASENVVGSPPYQGELRRAAALREEQSMGELADGTGGVFFHGSNDLGAGFKQVTAAPEVVYLLELSLDGVKADGTDHRLKVKVHRKGVQIEARRGYFMPKPEKSKK